MKTYEQAVQDKMLRNSKSDHDSAAELNFLYGTNPHKAYIDIQHARKAYTDRCEYSAFNNG